MFHSRKTECLFIQLFFKHPHFFPCERIFVMFVFILFKGSEPEM